MPDAFVVGLVGGLMIIAILIAAFGPGFDMSGYSAAPPVYKIAKNLTAATLVGEEEKEFSKVYTFDFDVSNVKRTRTEGTEYKKVYSGLFFGEDSLKLWMRAQDVEDARVSFRVTDTNGYGPLVIRVNGNAVFSEVLNIGEYSIELPVNESNYDYNVDILAGSSGARMWAPAFYELKDVNLEITSYAVSSSQVKFTMDDFQRFSRGEVQLQFDDRFGRAVVEMNGREIFRGSADEFQLVKFEDRIGYENLLTIKSERNSRFTGSGALKLYYKDYTTTKIEMPFDVTSQRQKSGQIRFDIVDVQRSGGYTVKVYSGDELLFSEYHKAEEGEQRFSFRPAQGENKLVIEAVDRAAFYAKYVEVSF